jgi:hypothetical protein
MKTTAEFLDELLGPGNCKMELPNGKWVNARPIEFQYGAAAEWWRALWRRASDAKQVLLDRADAVGKR